MSGFNAGTLGGAVVLDLSNWSGNAAVVRAEAKQVSAVMTGDLAAASKAASGAIEAVSTAAKEAAVTNVSLAQASAQATTANRAAAPAVAEVAKQYQSLSFAVGTTGEAWSRVGGRMRTESQQAARAVETVAAAQKVLTQTTAAVAAESKVAAASMREEAAAARQVESSTDRLKGQLAEIRGTFGRRGLVGQLVQLGLGGGAIGGINLLVGQLANFAQSAADASDALRTGEKSAGQVAVELARSVPIAGHLFSIGESIGELITGAKADLAAVNAEFSRLAKTGEAVRGLVVEGRAFAASMADAAKESRKAVETLSAPTSEQAAIQRRQKYVDEIGKINTALEQQKKKITEDPKTSEALDLWFKEKAAAAAALAKAQRQLDAPHGEAGESQFPRAADELRNAADRQRIAQFNIDSLIRVRDAKLKEAEKESIEAAGAKTNEKLRGDLRELVDRAKAEAVQAGKAIAEVVKGLRAEAIKQREEAHKESAAEAADLVKQATEDANELAKSMADTTKALREDRLRVDELHTEAEISNLRRVGRVFKAEQVELQAQWKKRIDAAVTDEERLAAKQAYEAARRLQRQRQEEELRQHPREHARDRADLEGEHESLRSIEDHLRRRNRGLEARGPSNAGRGPSPQFRRSAQGRRRFGDIVDEHVNDLNGARAAAAAVHVNVQSNPIDAPALAAAIGQEVTNKLLPQVRQEIQRIQNAANAAAHAAKVKGGI